MALARAHELRVLEPFGLQRAEELKSTLRQMIALHADATAEQDADVEVDVDVITN